MSIEKIVVSGARGEGFAETARRVGTVAGIAVPADATDAEVLNLMSSALSEVVAAAGYSVISPVRAATTANITLSGAQTIDGVSVVAGNRVLVKDQTSGAQNGIYVAAAGAWSRATDFDQTAEVLQGSYVVVTDGAAGRGAWVLVTADPITVGTTVQVWHPFDLNASFVTKAGSETISNKSFSGPISFFTDGQRIGITNEAAALTPEALVHAYYQGTTGAEGNGLRVESHWIGATGNPYENNDNTLFETFNTVLSDSANQSWSVSAPNYTGTIPAGVIDSGHRTAIYGWSVSVSNAGTHEGTIAVQYGVFGRAGFLGSGSVAGATVQTSVGVRGEIVNDSAGCIIEQAFAGTFVTTSSTGENQENIAVYAEAGNGTTFNYSFWGQVGKLYNADQAQFGSNGKAGTQSSSVVSVRGAGNAVEFGHPDASGYGSNIGATLSSGAPFIALCAENDAGNTFRTRGKLGVVITTDLSGSLRFSRVTNSNATGQTPTLSAQFDASGHFLPGADNTMNLGSGSVRWKELFAGTGTINTSDEREKTEIGAIPDEWLDAWADVEWQRFKFVGGKRWHTGLVAQRVHAAFEAHGLDAFEIGLCCYDSWEEETEEVTEQVMRTRTVKKLERVVAGKVKRSRKDGRPARVSERYERVEVEEEYPELVPTGETRVVREAGDLWGLRYDECFAMEAAWQRRELSRLRQAIGA